MVASKLPELKLEVGHIGSFAPLRLLHQNVWCDVPSTSLIEGDILTFTWVFTCNHDLKCISAWSILFVSIIVFLVNICSTKLICVSCYYNSYKSCITNGQRSSEFTFRSNRQPTSRLIYCTASGMTYDISSRARVHGWLPPSIGRRDFRAPSPYISPLLHRTDSTRMDR